MTVQFAGSRSLDERRRRRLAVSGDGNGTDAADLADEKPLPDCVPAEFCAAAPWIPRAPWKLWTLTSLLLAGVTAVAAMLFRAPNFGPEITAALDPLLQGTPPRLVIYLETIFWTLSGQLALLIGWHRAHSRLDFRGRYRVWPWVAALMFFSGLCLATNLHHGLGSLLDQAGWLPRIDGQPGWRIPALCLILPAWLLIDRDARRSLAAVCLLRLSLVMFLTGILAEMTTSSWIDKGLVPVMETLCGLAGSAMLMLSMWVLGWYVAYVTPDPPAAGTWKMPRLWNPFGWVLGLCLGLFRRRAAEEEEAAPAPTRRRKKSTEEAGTTRRKRKPRRVTKPRTRKAAEDDAVAEDELSEDESEELDEELAPSADQDVSDDEVEDTAPRRTVAQAVAKSPSSPASSPGQRSGSASPATSAEEQEEDDEDDDGGQTWRIDGPSQEQLKGLSKRQRRALIKQHRDQQRGQR